MTNSGGATRESILSLIKDIRDFNEAVDEEIKEIQRDANELNDCWDDPQYNDFLLYTLQITQQLKSDTRLLEEIADFLQGKVNLM